eukprot:gene3499-2450_t
MRELGSCCVRFYFVYRGILKMIEFGCNRFLFVITIGYMFYIRYDVSLIDCIPLLWVSPEFMLLCLWIVFVYHILQAVVDSLGYKFTVSFAGLLSATWCAVALFILTVVRLFGVAFARHCDFGCIFCGLYCDAGHLSDAWVLSLQVLKFDTRTVLFIKVFCILNFAFLKHVREAAVVCVFGHITWWDALGIGFCMCIIAVNDYLLYKFDCLGCYCLRVIALWCLIVYCWERSALNVLDVACDWFGLRVGYEFFPVSCVVVCYVVRVGLVVERGVGYKLVLVGHIMVADICIVLGFVVVLYFRCSIDQLLWLVLELGLGIVLRAYVLFAGLQASAQMLLWLCMTDRLYIRVVSFDLRLHTYDFYSNIIMICLSYSL